ncbi:hypothetical protein LCGC14_0951160 [marine sediment metagenome]|uniref:DNA methylase N-4/N-6 domain-containing protein n=1 Tax=marine sediment metagenome TaxID=412755 RepID=A0A0F9R0Q8_9ZZZZ
MKKMIHKIGECTLYLGDSLEIMNDFPDNSIDMVFTDPPYGKDFISLYVDTAKQCKRLLKDKGIAVFYASDYWFVETFNKMCKYLDYFYLFHLELPGQNALIFPRNITIGCKTLIVFSKGKTKSINRINNFIRSPQRDIGKVHKWQQSLYPAEYLIKGFSNENDVVLDPFLGSGTTGVACQNTNRKFIGIEIDEEFFRDAIERVENNLF